MAIITLENGQRVHINQVDLNIILRKVNPNNYYESTSKGLIPIAEMESHHLRNAILKSLRQSIEDAKNLEAEELCYYLITGVGQENPVLMNMIREYTKRNLSVI